MKLVRLLPRLTLLLILAMVGFVLTACDTTTTTTTITSTTTSTSETTTSTSASTETTTTTLPTTTTSNVISNSPLPTNDTREAAVYESGKLVIDNTNREFSYRNARLIENTSASGSIGDNYVDNASSSRFVGSYKPVISVSGYYKVYISFPILDNPADEIYLQVDYEGGMNSDYTKVLDESINAGYWVMVGTYYMPEGEGNAVHIFGVNGYDVAADAVLFELSVAIDDVSSEGTLESIQPKAPGSVVNILQTHQYEMRLSLNGELFFVNGVDGVDELGLLAEAGGNAARTYSVSALNDGAILDEAEANGIKIIIGLWMNHESSSFTYYNNPSAVEAQYQTLCAAIEQYKDHPAVLGWAVGNEVDISTSAHPEAIYAAMNAIAKYIHQSDPYHPTMAVLAGSSTLKISSIMRLAPHIDIIGINTYKAIANAAGNLMSWKGPYMITEYALNQPSETTLRTSWGAIIEPTNAEKAALYYQRTMDYVMAYSNAGCVGSFAFKDTGGFRITHTWYGIIYDHLKTSQYYAMMAAWTQTEYQPRLEIEQVTIGGKVSLESVRVLPGSSHTIVVQTDQTDLSALTFQYEVRAEVSISTNSVPAVRTDFTFDELGDANTVTMNVPSVTGGYRLYVYVRNENGDVSTYNFPFYVTDDIEVLEDEPGIQIIQAGVSIGYSESGSFLDSSNRIYQSVATRYTRETNASSTFLPSQVLNGTVEIYYYNLSSGLISTDDEWIQIEVTSSTGQTTLIPLQVTSLPEGWVLVGTFAFTGSGSEQVRVMKFMEGDAVVRSTAIAYLPIQGE